ALPPSIGTRHRSPFFGIISARPSALQNAPPTVLPASGSSRGAVACAEPGRSATYTFETPARSHTNTTCRPSGAHIAFDGCWMSISCSIVRPTRRCGCAAFTAKAEMADATTSAAGTTDFITGSINPTFRTPRLNRTKTMRKGDANAAAVWQSPLGSSDIAYRHRWLGDRPEDATAK